MRRWAHRFAVGCSALLLGGCGTAPLGPQEERAPPEATVGKPVELYGEHPLVTSVAVGASGVAHVAAITMGGTVLHFVVDQEGKVDRQILGQVDRDQVRDLAIGADGSVHLLLDTRYLRFSGLGLEEADAAGCERIALTPTQVLCSAAVYAQSTPGSVATGRMYGFGTPGIPRGTKVVIARYDAGAWSAIAMLEPDSDWDTLSATLSATPDDVVHVLYIAAGPVNASAQSTMTRLAAFRVPELGGEGLAALSGVDVWEIVPGTQPSFLQVDTTASEMLRVVSLWGRYGAAQAAADGAVVALVRPAGLAYTRFRSDQPRSLIPQDASDVVLVEGGRPVRELPVRAEDSGWASFVVTRLVARAGAGRFHVVTMSKDDLLGFVMQARYLQIIAGRWSTPMELGRVADRPDLIKLAAGEDGRAFVVLPLAGERFIGRWITPQP